MLENNGGSQLSGNLSNTHTHARTQMPRNEARAEMKFIFTANKKNPVMICSHNTGN